MGSGADIADGTPVVICWYDGGQLTALADDGNENGEPDMYLYGPDVRELVEAGRDVHGPTVRAVTVPGFRKMAGEEVLEDFPKLARYRGTPGYASLLELAENLVDGDMRAEIDLDLEEFPLDEPDAWAENGCAEYGALLGMDAGSWREDGHGGALWVEYEDEDELPPRCNTRITRRGRDGELRCMRQGADGCGGADGADSPSPTRPCMSGARQA